MHLREQGSSYVGESEVFASAAALPVTDMVVRRSDGALYFTTGGRRLQSALYRVTYTGSADLPAGGELAGGEVMRAETEGMRLRTLRHDLEQLHETSNAEVEIDVVCEALPCLPTLIVTSGTRPARRSSCSRPRLGLSKRCPNDVNARIEFAIAAARHARHRIMRPLLAWRRLTLRRLRSSKNWACCGRTVWPR